MSVDRKALSNVNREILEIALSGAEIEQDEGSSRYRWEWHSILIKRIQ